MRNEYILNSRVFLFAGAGASNPFDKWLMDEFIDHLIEQIYDWQKPPKGLHGFLDTIIKYRGKDLENILKELNDLTDKDEYLGDLKTINYIHDVLDGEEITMGRSGAFVLSGDPPFIPSPFSKNYARLNSMCVSLRQKIETLLFDHYGVVDKKKVVDAYSPLINLLIENIGDQKVLPLFTTNYDICFEEYADSTNFELVDGFSRSGRDLIWREEAFDSFRPEIKKKYLILFKLHGSVTWYDDSGIIKYFSAPIHRADKEKIKNVIIYPAKNKIALDNPFFTAYDYFQRCLDRAQIGIFIGYSFRDYDTVTKIRSALKFNDNLKILILSPNASQIITGNFRDFQDRVIPLAFRFGLKSDEESYLKEVSKCL